MTAESFSALVARHMERIAQGLTAARTPHGSAPSAADALADPRDVAALRHATLTEVGGAHLFLDDETAPPGAYRIYARERGRADSFRLVLALEVGADPDAFVRAAQSAILGRQGEAGGPSGPAVLLRRGLFTTGKLLKTLLASDEARRQPRALLVVPDTSAWLAGQASVPTFVEVT